MSCLHVGTLQPSNNRSLEVHLVDNLDETLGDSVAADDTTEDVDEDGSDLGVAGNQVKRLPDSLRCSTATNVEEVGWRTAVQLDNVHGSHGETGTVDKAANVTVELDDTSFNHFVVKIVTFTSTFTDTTENRVTTVSLGDVVDQFLNQYRLTDTSTTEKTNLTTTSIRSQQVDNLDTGFKNFGSRGLINEFGSFGVNGTLALGVDGTTFIDGFTNDVDDTTESGRADGNGDGGTGVSSLGATYETLRTWIS